MCEREGVSAFNVACLYGAFLRVREKERKRERKKERKRDETEDVCVLDVVY